MVQMSSLLGLLIFDIGDINLDVEVFDFLAESRIRLCCLTAYSNLRSSKFYYFS